MRFLVYGAGNIGSLYIERVDVPTPSIDAAYRQLSPASAAAE